MIGLGNLRRPRQSGFSTIRTSTILGLVFCLAFAPAAWGKTRLVRRFRPGQQLVYQTAVKTEVSISSNPETLKALLPPIPRSINTRQQNTVTVRSIDSSGIAEVENRFDRFEFDTQLDESLPEDVRATAAAAEEEFAQQLNGQTLTARYDRAGRLLGFDGADDALQDLDAPMQEAAKQTLRVFLEQMGGGALYPDHPLKEGEEWNLSMDSPPTENFPYRVEGENILRFVGKTRHGKVKAAIIESHFSNLLKPSEDPKGGTSDSIEARAQAMGLKISIRGEGEGRLLVALDDGRVLQNQATIRQTLNAEMPQTSAIKTRLDGPLSLQIESETTIQVRETGLPLP